MAVQLTRRKFTVDEYDWMARVGILTEDERVELIDGEIVEMAPIDPEHADRVDLLAKSFFDRFGDLARVRVQNPLHLDEYEQPQPDLALVRRPTGSYRHAHPRPDDVLLVVEVADTSLALHRRVKLPLYARAGIPEVWLVDLQHELVHVYQEPTGDGYRVTRTARRGERVAPAAFPDRDLAVNDLLG
jgi:Uma2 family endonuclease